MSLQELENHLWLAGVYAVVIYGAALLWASLWLHIPQVANSVTSGKGRYGSLDGLRGVLAVGVFVHHSFTAFIYFSGGKWQWSQNPLLNHLGQTTVAIFFAITGFLFTRKSLAASIDWKQFYLDRIARLWPAYLLVVAVVFAAAFVLTGGSLREPPVAIVKELLQWISLGYYGAPDINGLQDSWTLIAGVNWSLRYELLFYVFAVPVLFIAARFLPQRALLLGAAVLFTLVLLHQYRAVDKAGNGLHAAHFLSGIIAAYLYSEQRALALMRGKPFLWIGGLCGLSLLWILNAYPPMAIVFTLVLFCAFVGGLSPFGLLNTKPALWLGDISYGIYLMHGLILWGTLYTLRATGLLATLTVLPYGLIIAGIGLLIVSAASLSYVCVELPIMAASKGRKVGLKR